MAEGLLAAQDWQAEPLLSIMPSTTASPRYLFITICVVVGLLAFGATALLFEEDIFTQSSGKGVTGSGADISERKPESAAVEKGAFRRLSKFARNQFHPAVREQLPDTMTLDRVLSAISKIPAMSPGEETDARELALVERWVSFEPQRACEYAYNAVLDGADEGLLKGAVSAWARIDPASASRWASRLRSPLLRDIAVSTAYGIWASANQVAAMNSLKFFPGSSARSSAWSGMANVGAKSPKVALEWAKKLPGPLREKTLQQVFGAWIHRDPLAVAEWLSTKPVKIQLSLAGRVASEWARKDPQMALFWSRAVSSGPLTGPQLPPGPVQRRALDAALGSFVSSDPEAAAAWMATGAGSPYFPQWVASLASSWASIDPVTAAAWALTIPSGKNRDAALGSIAASWTRADPPEALRWIQGLSRSSDLNTALSSFGTTLAASDPEMAAYWSSQISDRSLREETLSRVVSRWRTINAGAAAQFVQTSPAATFLRKKP